MIVNSVCIGVADVLRLGLTLITRQIVSFFALDCSQKPIFTERNNSATIKLIMISINEWFINVNVPQKIFYVPIIPTYPSTCN